MAHSPVGSGSSLSARAGIAATSAAIAQKSNTLRVTVVSGESGFLGAHVAIGTNPNVSSSSYFIPKGEPQSINIYRPSSQRVVGITTGATTTIQLPEGTGSPFVVGSRVNLTVPDQSYYDDLVGFATVSAIDNTAGVKGSFGTKITIDADTSGIVTAYSSVNYAQLRNSFKVETLGVGVGSDTHGAVYFQQVQISGEG